jgi:hypothetical protein
LRPALNVFIKWVFLHNDLVLRSSAVDLSEGEDIPETTRPVTETGDHGGRPKLLCMANYL